MNRNEKKEHEMAEERTVVVNGVPHTVVLSDDHEALAAAYAAGRAVVGLLTGKRQYSDLSPAQYVLERADDADEEFLERVVRRRLKLPWIIAQTERLTVREFVRSDFEAMRQEEARDLCLMNPEGNDREACFEDEEAFAAYISHQYPYYEYGIWALEERGSKRIIGRAGLMQMTDSINDYTCSDRTAEGICSPRSGKIDGGAADEISDAAIELGYHIFTPHRRKGCALEACEAILSCEAPRVTDCVYVRIEEGNTASIRLAGRLGFSLIGKTYTGSARCSYLYSRYCS